jgi:hypothetical protein
MSVEYKLKHIIYAFLKLKTFRMFRLEWGLIL